MLVTGRFLHCLSRYPPDGRIDCVSECPDVWTQNTNKTETREIKRVRNKQMHGWMIGWSDRWIERWLDEWKYWFNGWVYSWMNRQMDGWIIFMLKPGENVYQLQLMLIFLAATSSFCELMTPSDPYDPLSSPEQFVADQQRVDGQSVRSSFYVSDSVQKGKQTNERQELLLVQTAGSGSWPIEGSVGLVLQHLVEIFQGFHFSSRLDVKHKNWWKLLE